MTSNIASCVIFSSMRFLFSEKRRLDVSRLAISPERIDLLPYNSIAASHEAMAVAKSCLTLRSSANKCQHLSNNPLLSGSMIDSSSTLFGAKSTAATPSWSPSFVAEDKARLMAAIAASVSLVSARTNANEYKKLTLSSSPISGVKADRKFAKALFCKSDRDDVS